MSHPLKQPKDDLTLHEKLVNLQNTMDLVLH